MPHSLDKKDGNIHQKQQSIIEKCLKEQQAIELVLNSDMKKDETYLRYRKETNSNQLGGEIVKQLGLPS